MHETLFVPSACFDARCHPVHGRVCHSFHCRSRRKSAGERGLQVVGGQSVVTHGVGQDDDNSKGDAEGWYENAYYDEVGYSQLSITSEKAHSGQYSALVENASSNDARFVCTVAVKPNTTYKLSGYVFVESMEPGGNGANLAVEDLYAFSDCLFDTTGEWQYVEWYGQTGFDQKSVTIGVRVGGYGAESIGKAYFDDISLEKVDKVPQGFSASSWYVYKEAPKTDENPTMSQHHNHVALCFLFGFLFAFLINLYIQPVKALYK